VTVNKSFFLFYNIARCETVIVKLVITSNLVNRLVLEDAVIIKTLHCNKEALQYSIISPENRPNELQWSRKCSCYHVPCI